LQLRETRAVISWLNLVFKNHWCTYFASTFLYCSNEKHHLSVLRFKMWQLYLTHHEWHWF